jgi:threonine/homoserine/homoserine lactone efflux protein
MISLTTLLLFMLAVLALFLSPGPNMAFVVSHGIAYGPRGGFAAALGIGSADIILTLLTASGVTAIVTAWSPSFDLLRYFGSVYLIWLAFKALHASDRVELSNRAQLSSQKIYAAAMFNSLLNPKALLFFMVFLPQFVDAQRENMAWQLLILGSVLSAMAVIFTSVLGIFSGQAGRFLQSNARAAKYQRWFLSSVLTALAVRLFFIEPPAHN